MLLKNWASKAAGIPRKIRLTLLNPSNFVKISYLVQISQNKLHLYTFWPPMHPGMDQVAPDSRASKAVGLPS
jgi:hypothetical protein